MKNRFNEGVVVIIDEYDKPLLSTIDIPEYHIAMRNELKSFYGVLKSSDAYLKFVFLTGVTKFSHVSVFSDLNHLSDLSLDTRYADLCGFTQEELEACFEPEINTILKATGRDRTEYIENIRRYYNGYRFSKLPLKVYNPFGLLNHFDKNGDFDSYWYDTGTPTFLVKLVTQQKINIANLGNMLIRNDDFYNYDVENMEALPILYQSGYLTISYYDENKDLFTLDYPNIEVRSAFAISLLDQYLKAPKDRSRTLLSRLPYSMENGDVEGIMNALRQFLASIPYDIIKETENYFQTAIHLIFSMLGLNCRSEVRIASGRIDTLLETKNFVYCSEFKLNGTAEEALIQIDTKEYLLPWAGSGKKQFKVGVAFDHKKRNISIWKSSLN